jgi:hypothetical protein
MELIFLIIIGAFFVLNVLMLFVLRADIKGLAQRQDALWQEMVAIRQTTADTHQIMLQVYRFMGLTNSGNKGA